MFEHQVIMIYDNVRLFQPSLNDHYFYLRRQRRKQFLESGHYVRLSVRLSVPKSCHRNSSDTIDPIIMKLGM